MFITSVIMVVVMAIALTTSSLAWFTAAGSSTVTTSALTLSAKATSAAGLLISSSSSAGAWYGNIDLATGNAQANMVPAVPYQYAENNTILDALVGENFISNKVDMNGKWDTAAAAIANTASDVLYFEKEFWITTVDTTNDLVVAPTIAWTKNVNNADVAYPGENNANMNSSDPVIYVAVLADKNCEVAADRNPSGVTSNDTSRASSANWEILNIFASTGAATVNFGGQASAFTSSSALTDYASATTALTIGGTSGTYVPTTTANKTTDKLDKVTTHYNTGEALATGEVKRFKVVAWYDGNALINSNSNFALKFTLTFTATTYVGS